MLKLKIMIGSTRPIRAGKPVGDWFAGHATADARFQTEVLDLKEIALPFLAEPKKPALGEYALATTKAWSATISDGDAFVIVTPEYNWGMTAPVKNAIDTLLQEWEKKPIGFVSYGGVAGGQRAVGQLRQVCAAIEAVDLPQQVVIRDIGQLVDKERTTFAANERHDAAAKRLLDALATWGTMLKAAREGG